MEAHPCSRDNMTTPERTSSHRTSSIVVATAAVTVALGVTVASLAGYLGPRAAAPPQRAGAPVVLVPVTSEPAAAPAPAEPEPMFADYVPTREHEREEHHGRHHRERHHDDD